VTATPTVTATVTVTATATTATAIVIEIVNWIVTVSSNPTPNLSKEDYFVSFRSIWLHQNLNDNYYFEPVTVAA